MGVTHLATGAVTDTKLHADAVTTVKIADGAVTTAKLANSAVTRAKIIGAAVGTQELDAEAVTSTELANGAVITAKLADGAVTSDKIADGAITLDKIPSEEITADKLAPGSVTTSQIEFNAVTSAELANGAVTTAKIANGAVTAGKLASGVIPTKTSDLQNDSGFLTQHQDISGKADKATTLAGYGITNSYTKSEIDGVFMELAPDTNPGSISVLEDGQLFRCQGSVALKTGNSADYIELAKKSIVPTKTSDLQNDSGFVSDLSDYMRLAHTTSSQDSGQFYLDRYGLSENAVNLYLALYNSESKRVAWYSDLPDISGKADIESGNVPSNHAWYTQEGDGYTMTGNYTIIGNMCFLCATAYLIQGWERVYYSLPVAATASASTIALHNDGTFTIATGTQSNISVLEIRQIGSQYMSTGGTISFTLVYKCS